MVVRVFNFPLQVPSHILAVAVAVVPVLMPIKT
jgi:hypothetical protein